MRDPVPQYLPREHVGLFQRHRALARIFDQAFRVPGTNWRFGLDALLEAPTGDRRQHDARDKNESGRQE